MSPEQEDRIKQRAYEIWEREGCPDGRGDVHWSMAVQEIRAEDGWVDDAADSDGPTDDLSRQLGSAEAALAPEGATTTAEEPAPAKKSRAKKTAAPKVEATKPAEAAETAEPTEAPKKARKAAASKPAVSAKTSASKTEAKTTAASKEVAEKPKRAAKVKA